MYQKSSKNRNVIYLKFHFIIYRDLNVTEFSLLFPTILIDI